MGHSSEHFKYRSLESPGSGNDGTILDTASKNEPCCSPHRVATSVSPLSIIHIVVLHLLYFNCLTTVHHVSFQNRLWTKAVMRENNEGLGAVQHQLCHSALRCIEAARASMHLMKLAPQGDFACTWYAKYERLHLVCANPHFNRILLSYCVSAIVIVLAKILHMPTHSFAHSDMDLVRPQIQLLNSLAENQSTEEIERMREFCNELAGRAQIALYGSIRQLKHRNWLRDGETTQPLPVYGSQADAYTNQNSNPETNSAVLVCQSCSIKYPSAENEFNPMPLKDDLQSSNIYTITEPTASNSKAGC